MTLGLSWAKSHQTTPHPAGVSMYLRVCPCMFPLDGQTGALIIAREAAMSLKKKKVQHGMCNYLCRFVADDL